MTSEIEDLKFQLECYKYVIAAITYSIPSFCGKSSPEEYVKLYMRGIIKSPEIDPVRDEEDLRRELLRKGPPTRLPLA